MNYERIKFVLLEVQKLKLDTSKKSKLFRKRNGEEILKSGFSTGCSDFALAAKYLFKKENINTLFIETLNKSNNGLKGHVYLKHEDLIIDPTTSSVSFSENILKKWDWYSESEKLKSLEELKEINRTLLEL